jgi:hypothetical protein
MFGQGAATPRFCAEPAAIRVQLRATVPEKMTALHPLGRFDFAFGGSRLRVKLTRTVCEYFFRFAD